jgi:Apea-like HEPN
MVIKIHPSAAINFNTKADELISLIEEFPKLEVRQSSFPSDLHIAASFTEKDIIGDIEEATSDYLGNTVARFFYFGRKKLGLNEENYRNLRDLAERIQSLPTIRSMLSCKFIEKALFSYISKKYKKMDIADFFIEYLNSEAQTVVKTITSWIPIANLEVQCAFPISNSEICPLSKALIDKWQSRFESLIGEDKGDVIKLFEKIRKDNQGLASIVTIIEAEPEYASDYALEEAQKITAILGIFSGATLIPNLKCISNIKGSENVAHSTIFLEDIEDNLKISNGIVDSSSSKFWRLGQREIIEIRKTGLDKISSLLTLSSPKDFEKSVLNSIFLYSKSAFTADPVEKVVHMLSSLESILLKNENEPIQQNLAERIAVFTAQELNERKFIIKTIKSVYGIRSRYLHHGHTSSELKLISDFMMQVWMFYIQILANVDRFRDKNEFINSIDDHKLA